MTFMKWIHVSCLPFHHTSVCSEVESPPPPFLSLHSWRPYQRNPVHNGIQMGRDEQTQDMAKIETLITFLKYHIFQGLTGWIWNENENIHRSYPINFWARYNHLNGRKMLLYYLSLTDDLFHLLTLNVKDLNIKRKNRYKRFVVTNFF